MERQRQLQSWLELRLKASPIVLEPASADASFRRYFRVRAGDRTLIAMDAPPRTEDCRPFVRVAALMSAAGVHVPQVLEQDLEQGFLLLTDLGTRGYLSALRDRDPEPLFRDAIDTLLRWQLASKPGVLPPYDAALLRRELELFPQWYIERHRGKTPSPAQRQALSSLFETIIANNLAQPRVYVHRDYMPRNLMVCDPNPGVLDFQDAVLGPITYDVVSLFRDAFISWDEKQEAAWVIQYWSRARQRGLPVAADFAAFYRDFEWMGLQRHLKVLGIFARLSYRDGKGSYLDDTPRFITYARHVARRYRELTPLLALLDEVEEPAR